ncbi:MAG: hypothetical protein IJJ73_10540 [Bacteroidaceae bacterium]|nr:hypothetical protein [Bacteroidaceae bacterium]
MLIINNTVYFESDAEFEDFSIAPYISIKQGATSVPNGDYSDLYKQYLAEGKSFVIMDEDSIISERQVVCKRVPVKMDGRPIGRDYLVQLRIKNLEPWFDDMLMPEDLEPKEREAITKLINNNPHVTYKQIAETLNTCEEEALGIFKWWQKEGIIK